MKELSAVSGLSFVYTFSFLTNLNNLILADS